MRRIILLSIAFSFLLFTQPSFAASREEAINNALATIEILQSLQQLPQHRPQQRTAISEMNSSANVEAVSPVKNTQQAAPFEKGEVARDYSSPNWQSQEASSGLKEYSRSDIVKIPSVPLSKTEEIISEEDESKKVKNNGLYISGSYLVNHFHYAETSEAGEVLDRDYGNLKGFYASIGYRSNYLIEGLMGRPFIQGYFWQYSGEITYDGALQDGTPFMTDEKEKVQRFGVKIGAYKDLSSRLEMFGYLDAGRRMWRRGENKTIGSVIEYLEKYYWSYIGFGGGVNYNLFPRLSLGVEAEWMLAISPKMKAYLYEGGTFDLGNTYGVDVKLPVRYFLLKNLSFDVTPYYTYWKIKSSNIVAISGDNYYEPDSTTNIRGILAGFTYNF